MGGIETSDASYADSIRGMRVSVELLRETADAWRRLSPDQITPFTFAVLSKGAVEIFESLARDTEASADALERAERKILRLENGRTNS